MRTLHLLLLSPVLFQCMQVRAADDAKPKAAGTQSNTKPKASGDASKNALPDDGKPREIALPMQAFVQMVLQTNLNYAAERYNVSIAEAEIAAARQIPNPELNYGFSRDITYAGSQRLQSNTVGNIQQLFETGGKRRLRTEVARKSKAATEATLDGFLNQLKSDAAMAFVEALTQRRLAQKSRDIARDMQELVKAQLERYKAGQISEADYLQTEIEEQQFQTELRNTDAQAESASQALGAFIGVEGAFLRLIPVGNLEQPEQKFDAKELTTQALGRRGDLVALRHQADAASSRVSLEKANRIPDVTVGMGISQLSSTQNNVAPTPANNSLVMFFSLPLPIWNQNKAAIENARQAALQAQKQIQAAELKTQVEVRQALTLYRAAVDGVARYQAGILKNAGIVLDARQISYQKGQATLLDLLTAQRTAREVRANYEAALAAQARAHIEVLRVSGTWSIPY